MAGHSHSANIKHRKNAVDAKRAKVFSKLARNIISAARQGGGEPDTNLKLKYAVEKARAANMPKRLVVTVTKAWFPACFPKRICPILPTVPRSTSSSTRLAYRHV